MLRPTAPSQANYHLKTPDAPSAGYPPVALRSQLMLSLHLGPCSAILLIMGYIERSI